jgi:hypothetical protein
MDPGAGISTVEAIQNLLSVIPSVRVVGHLVDRDRNREDETFVLARGDLNPVGVAQREPVLRYASDRLALIKHRTGSVDLSRSRGSRGIR